MIKISEVNRVRLILIWVCSLIDEAVPAIKAWLVYWLKQWPWACAGKLASTERLDWWGKMSARAESPTEEGVNGAKDASWGSRFTHMEGGYDG